MNSSPRPSNPKNANINPINLPNMKVSGKVWIPAGIIAAVLVASLAFFSFVNPHTTKRQP